MVEHRVLPAALRYRQLPRKRLKPVFQWGNPFEGWARNFIRKNQWRTAHSIGDPEDALQECAMIFAKCKARYEGKIDHPKHMMRLFQTSVQRHWHSLAVRDGHIRDVEAPALDDAAVCRPASQIDYNAGPLAAALAQLGEEGRELIHAVLNAPAELLDILFRTTDTESMNRRAVRLFGITSASADDLFGKIRALARSTME